MTGISNGQILAIANNEDFELVQVISAGGSTFTANLTKPHDSGSIVTGGGATGYFIELSVDNGTTAMGTNNTLHYAWPILSSSSNTALTVWMASNGGYIAYTGAWANSAGQNGGVVYPGAEVYSVQSAGALSNTLGLGPNIAPWTNGDTVIEPLYPAEALQGINLTTNTYFPSQQSYQTAGLSANLMGVPSLYAVGALVRNWAANSWYTCCGGYRQPPQTAYQVQGLFSYGLQEFVFPTQALIQAGCPAAGCSANINSSVLLVLNNNGAYDGIGYNALNEKWAISTGSGSGVPTYYGLSSTEFYAAANTTSSLGDAGNPWSGVFLKTGFPVSWNSDTGISRGAANEVDCGNGTQGDKTCTLKAANGTFTGAVSGASYNTATNCAVNSVSPAACGSAASGAVVIPTTTTTYTVNTTAVTTHSRIMLQWLSFASDLPGSPTCVPPVATTEPTISAVSTGTSFTISLGSTTGQTCPMFEITN
jgi:hypothetical protein